MKRVLLPPKTRVFQQDGWFLYFDPNHFAWVRVNESGHFLLQQIGMFRTAEQIVDEIETRFEVSNAEARASYDSFVDSLVESGFLHVDAYQDHGSPKFQQRDFAWAVYIHLTNDCNLKCPYCYNKSDREYKQKLQAKGRLAPILTTDEYKTLLTRLVELDVGRIFFTGGEPLMRPDALELMEFTRSLSDEVGIEVLTNAILIKEDVAEKLCDTVDMVTISLDGHEKHLHERYRGKNTFRPTIKGIETLVAVRNRRQVDSPQIALVPALTAENIGFLREIFEFSLDKLGVDLLAPIIFQAGDHQALSLAQVPTVEEWSDAQKELIHYISERQKRLDIKKEEAMGVPPRNHCGVGHGEISLDPCGYVYPCQSLHFDEFIAGNVRDEDVQEIFENSPVLRSVRDVTVDRVAACGHCDFRNLCSGGCRATAYHVYSGLDTHNEIYCRHLEKIAVDRMWSASDVPVGVNVSACI